MEDTGSIYECGFVVLVYGTLITKGSASKTQEEMKDGLIRGRKLPGDPGVYWAELDTLINSCLNQR